MTNNQNWPDRVMIDTYGETVKPNICILGAMDYIRADQVRELQLKAMRETIKEALYQLGRSAKYAGCSDVEVMSWGEFEMICPKHQVPFDGYCETCAAEILKQSDVVQGGNIVLLAEEAKQVRNALQIGKAIIKVDPTLSNDNPLALAIEAAIKLLEGK